MRAETIVTIPSHPHSGHNRPRRARKVLLLVALLSCSIDPVSSQQQEGSDRYSISDTRSSTHDAEPNSVFGSESHDDTEAVAARKDHAAAGEEEESDPAAQEPRELGWVRNKLEDGKNKIKDTIDSTKDKTDEAVDRWNKRRKRRREHVDAVGSSMVNKLGFFSSTKPAPAMKEINDFLKGFKLELGSVRNFSLPLKAKMSLRDFVCDSFEVEDLEHDFNIPNNNKGTATMDVKAKEMIVGCSSRYKYHSGKWYLPSFSGKADYSLSTSFDLKTEFATTNSNRNSFNTHLPTTARVLSCDSNTKVGIKLSGNIVEKALSALLGPLTRLLQGVFRDMLCDKVEKDGGVALTEMLTNLEQAMEPFVRKNDNNNNSRAAYDIADVDKNLPQTQLDAAKTATTGNSNLQLMDYMDDSTYRVTYDDFNTFAGDYGNILKDLCDTLKQIWEDRTSSNRKLAILATIFGSVAGLAGTAGLSAGLSMVVSMIVQIISGLLTEFFGEPEDIIKLLLDYLMDSVMNGGDDSDSDSDSSDTGNSTRVRRTKSQGEPWSFELLDMVFLPDVIPVVSNDRMSFSLNSASIAGSAVDNFSLSPIGRQTLDARADLDRMDAKADMWFDFKAATMDMGEDPSNQLKLTIPPRRLDLSISTGVAGVSLGTALLAAIHVEEGKDTTSRDNVVDWTCEFFPKVRLAFLDVDVGTLIDPRIRTGYGFDNLVNSLLGQFVDLYKSVFAEVVQNYMGTQFRNSFDDNLQTMMAKAETNFVDKCEDRRRHLQSSSLTRDDARNLRGPQ